MARGRFRAMRARHDKRCCRTALCLALALMLIAHGFPVAAQAVGDPGERPVLRLAAPSGIGGDGDRGALQNAQFMPGMPEMIVPRAGATQGSMGGGMTMVMTGDTIMEMTAGACAAGLFIGGVAAAVATGPAAPISTSAVLSSAGIGCGFAVAATAAGMAGMMGWRALSDLIFQ